MSLPPASSVLFAKGVIARLAIWPVLRLAIDEGWAGLKSVGEEKRRWMVGVVVDAFEEGIQASSKDSKYEVPDSEYIETLLLQILADEFETHLEDGTAETVADDLCAMWAECQEDTTTPNSQLVDKFQDIAEKLKGRKTTAVVQASPADAVLTSGEFREDEDEWASDSDDEDQMDVDGDEPAPQLVDQSIPREKPEPVVDEDGFTLVQKKGRG